MKIVWRGNEHSFRIVGAYAFDGEVRVEAKHLPAPSTEEDGLFELDFHEAQKLRDNLDSALKDLPCPTCGRKHADPEGRT